VEHILKIEPDGSASTIYADEMSELFAEGTTKISRASHVEPDPNGSGWIADMSPVQGPVLGPFDLRQQALDAEVEYLKINLFN
jgi:hypothetical protein